MDIKRLLYMLLGAGVVFLVVLLVCRISGREEQQSPAVRYHEEQAGDTTAIEQAAEETGSHGTEQLSSQESGEKAEETENNENDIMEWNRFSIEFLSVEILDGEDLAAQDTYSAEDFYTEMLPEGTVTERFMDEETIKAECPELKDVWENREAYSVEEVKEIYSEHQDIIDRYTYDISVDMKYVFVKCRITNTSGSRMDLHMSELSVIASAADYSDWTNSVDNIRYFNQSKHTEGDERLHSFYLYSFEPGEVLECTLGFEVKDTIDNPVYFMGQVDTSLLETGDNLAYSKYVFNLSALIDMGE